MEINDALGRRVIINRKPEIFESHYYHRFPLVFAALDSSRDFFFIAVFCLLLVSWLCARFFRQLQLQQKKNNNNFQQSFYSSSQSTYTRKSLWFSTIYFDIEKWKRRRKPPQKSVVK